MSQSPGGKPGSIELANDPGRNQLKADAVTLPGVLMQSVTSIAPAIAGMFTVPFIVLNAGRLSRACGRYRPASRPGASPGARAAPAIDPHLAEAAGTAAK